jgi:hypothetical protein
MLESVDIRSSEPQLQKTSSDDSIVWCFMFVSFGYMLPWVSIGSLITYYVEEYGEDYFVYLNIAFYAVGYPVSYLQRRVDVYYDTIYGSKFTFRRRLEFCFAILMTLLMIIPTAGNTGTIILVALIGICTWMAHGSSSSLASVVKNNSNVVQQIGFALPGVYALIMHTTFEITVDSSRSKFYVFFGVTASLVFTGLLSWVSKPFYDKSL